jgi:hypothetical protein
VGIAIVIALNDPFKPEVDQRGVVDDEFPRLDLDNNPLRCGPVPKTGYGLGKQRSEEGRIFHSQTALSFLLDRPRDSVTLSA